MLEYDRALFFDGESLGEWDILIVGDRIAEIGDSISDSYDRKIDASGLLITPGLVDARF